VREIGSGVKPFTAARDLPPSEIEDLLRRSIDEPDLLLALYANGPMLHLDLAQDIDSMDLVLRRFARTGLDGQVQLRVDGDAQAAAAALEARSMPGETRGLGALLDRIAFTANGPVVTGRLQIAPEDLMSLGDRR
jgi:hypothetical protein